MSPKPFKYPDGIMIMLGQGSTKPISCWIFSNLMLENSSECLITSLYVQRPLLNGWNYCNRIATGELQRKNATALRHFFIFWGLITQPQTVAPVNPRGLILTLWLIFSHVVLVCDIQYTQLAWTWMISKPIAKFPTRYLLQYFLPYSCLPEITLFC